MTVEALKTQAALMAIVHRYKPDARRDHTAPDGQKPETAGATDRIVKRSFLNTSVHLSIQIKSLVDWMGKYGILQGIRDYAEGFAAVALKQFQQWGDQGKELNANDVMKRFNVLNNALTKSCPIRRKDKTDRSVLSMTSKLLWLQYPKSVPIYDKNAFQAINILWKLHKSLEDNSEYIGRLSTAKKPGQDRSRKVKGSTTSQHDQQVYADYCYKYFTLFNLVEDGITRELNGDGGFDLEPIRFFDRVLWLLGSNSVDAGSAL